MISHNTTYVYTYTLQTTHNHQHPTAPVESRPSLEKSWDPGLGYLGNQPPMIEMLVWDLDSP